MKYWIAQTLNGLSFSVMLFLLASGLSLIYGLMGVLNMLHGSFYLLGALLGLAGMTASGNFLVGLIVGTASVVVLGLLVERVFIRRVISNDSAQVLLTFGLLLIISDATLWATRGQSRLLPKPAFADGAVNLWGIVYPRYRLLVIAIGLVVALALWVLQTRTKVGTLVRAGVDDEEMARGLGINVPSLFTGIFAFGAFLGALAGVIGGPFFGVFQGVDLQVLIIAFVVVIVGGAGSLLGALVGSIAVGMIATFGQVLFPKLALFMVFAPMAAILILKPSGLFGRE